MLIFALKKFSEKVYISIPFVSTWPSSWQSLYLQILCLIPKTLLSFSSAKILLNLLLSSSEWFILSHFPRFISYRCLCEEEMLLIIYFVLFYFSAFLNSSEHLCNSSSPNSQETSGRLGIVGRGCTQRQF